MLLKLKGFFQYLYVKTGNAVITLTIILSSPPSYAYFHMCSADVMGSYAKLLTSCFSSFSQLFSKYKLYKSCSCPAPVSTSDDEEVLYINKCIIQLMLKLHF